MSHYDMARAFSLILILMVCIKIGHNIYKTTAKGIAAVGKGINDIGKGVKKGVKKGGKMGKKAVSDIINDPDKVAKNVKKTVVVVLDKTKNIAKAIDKVVPISKIIEKITCPPGYKARLGKCRRECPKGTKPGLFFKTCKGKPENIEYLKLPYYKDLIQRKNANVLENNMYTKMEGKGKKGKCSSGVRTKTGMTSQCKQPAPTGSKVVGKKYKYCAPGYTLTKKGLAYKCMESGSWVDGGLKPDWKCPSNTTHTKVGLANKCILKPPSFINARRGKLGANHKSWVYCKRGYKDFGAGKLITGGKPCRAVPPVGSGLTMQKDGSWYKPYLGEKTNGAY